MNIDGTNISMTRGDTESITVKCMRNNIEIPFQSGDIIYFTIKEDIYKETKILQQIITSFTDGKAIIRIEPADTSNLKFRKYVYDIQLTDKTGEVSTLIPPSEFRVLGEVTYE